MTDDSQNRQKECCLQESISLEGNTRPTIIKRQISLDPIMEKHYF